MNITNLLKNKKHVTAIVIGIIVIVILLSRSMETAQADKNNTQLTNPTQKEVTLIDLATLKDKEQTIATTGAVESLEQVELRSEVFGKITFVGVSLGDNIYKGQTIASLGSGNLVAQRAQAQADYDGAIVTKKQLEAQQTAGKANHEKIKITTQNAIAAAQTAVNTAENNVRLNADTTTSEIVQDAYEDMHSILDNAIITAENILYTTDGLLGVDNTLTNQDFKHLLSVKDITKKNIAETSYNQTKASLKHANSSVTTLTTENNYNQIENAIADVSHLLQTSQTHLTDTQTMLEATIAIGPITQTMLDTYQANIYTARTNLNTVSNSFANANQAISTAKTNLSQYTIAHEKAQRDFVDAQAQAQAEVAASAAQVVQLEANIQSQDTQIARARATIQGINASIGKTIIRSPISGTIAVLPAKTGEIAQNGGLIASIVNTDSMQIKTYVNSDDLADIHVGNIAYMNTQTIGTITHVAPSIDPATKKVEIIIAVNQEKKQHLVIGQFVDIDIVQTPKQTEEETTALLVPLTAVRIEPGQKTVFIINDENIVEEHPVVINRIIGDSIEVTAGLETLTTILASTRGIEIGESVTIIQ
jgi:RND family efflux transporter MFP subunit